MAAPGGGKDHGGAPGRSMQSRAELVKRWEDVFDDVGDDDGKATELFMTLLLRDARAEYARNEDDEQQRRRARVFEPWHPPPPPGSSARPPLPPVAAAAAAPRPRVERTVVLGLRAPPHCLLPRPRNVERTTTRRTTAPVAAADQGRSVKPEKN